MGGLKTREWPWIVRRRPGPGRPVFLAEAQCDKCNCLGEVRTKTHLPPEVIARKFEANDWTVRGNYSGMRCPSCSSGSDKHETEGDAEVTTYNGRGEGAGVAAVQPRPATMVEMRKIMLALEERFDVDKGCYTRPTDSDEVLARELDVPRAVLASVRDQAFGRIRAHPVVDDLEKKLDEAMAEFAAANTKASARLAEIADQIAKLKHKLVA